MEAGVLSELAVAFSRQPGTPKTYVQALLRERGAQLWGLLSQQGARVYVCGDARAMAPDVRAAFREIAVEHGGLAPAAAEAWLEGLRQGGAFLEDVWG